MNKRNKVIYTCIVGGFDSIIQPESVDDTYDYICFVEKGKTTESRIGIWQLREIPFEHKNSRVLSRFPKLRPHIVLPEYEYSLWLDGNVSIKEKSLYGIIEEKINNGIKYSGLCHWGRDCAYEEAIGCANSRKEPFLSLLRTIHFLKRSNFPRHYGLYENNVIFRSHKDENIIKFDDMWWNLYLKYSNRDQLCHPFCYRECGLEFDYILPRGYCSRNHPTFLYVKHLQRPVKKRGLKKLISDINRKSKVILLKAYTCLP